MKVKLEDVRLSFADLFEPKSFKPGDVPKYKGTFLIQKGSALDKKVQEAIRTVAKEKWGAKADQVLKSIQGNANKYCYVDGDTREYDGWAGMMALGAKNKSRPLIIDRDKTPLTMADGKPFSGCYVNATVEIFAYDNSGNGISASLKGVQYRREGDAFSGSAPANPDDFDDLGMEEGAEEDALA